MIISTPVQTYNNNYFPDNICHRNPIAYESWVLFYIQKDVYSQDNIWCHNVFHRKGLPMGIYFIWNYGKVSINMLYIG